MENGFEFFICFASVQSAYCISNVNECICVCVVRFSFLLFCNMSYMGMAMIHML